MNYKYYKYHTSSEVQYSVDLVVFASVCLHQPVQFLGIFFYALCLRKGHCNFTFHN